MAIYNPLSWQNENALSSYPFSEDIDVQDFIVDAKFVQFDNFLPILNYVLVERDRLNLTMTFDCGQIVDIPFYKEAADKGDLHRHLRIYTPSRERYLGVLSFGEGLYTLWTSYIGRKLVYNKLFLSDTVRSIPSKDAVYTLDGNFGEVQLATTTADNAIFYNVSTELNSITFNAVGGYTIPDDNTGRGEGLRKINLVKPLDNNINLASNDVVKITPLNASSLNIDLVSGSVSQSFIIPTLTT